ncbi:MAG: RluA family pseudouridine synthase [Bacillaceae bacterium]
MNITRSGEWCTITVPAQWNKKSIEPILVEEIGVPKKLLHTLRMEKGVTVNGESIPWRQVVSEGDTLSLHVLKEEKSDVVPMKENVAICYEDDYVLIANKPYGVDTHPNQKGESGTLLNAVVAYVNNKNEICPIRHIHRLDKDTTGGVVFAKYPLPGAIMDKMLAEKEINRQYVALVHGIVKQDKGTIHAKIGRDRHHATRRRVSPKGDDAITHYEVVKRFPKDNVSLVALTLETGRTHQIRVHMSYLGHALVGDTLYGGKTTLLRRQALHGANIVMKHPISKEKINVSVPLPTDMEQLVKKLK